MNAGGAYGPPQREPRVDDVQVRVENARGRYSVPFHTCHAAANCSGSLAHSAHSGIAL